MKNTLFRKATVGTLATVAAVGLSTLFATAASAHTVNAGGSSACGTDGKYTITWTVSNDHETTATLKNVTVGGKPADGAPTTLAPVHKDGSTKTFKTIHDGNTTGDVWLKGLATWPDEYSDDFEYKVELKGTCKAPTTPPPTPRPTTPAPTTPAASPSKSHTPEASSSTPGLPVTGSSTTLPMVGTGAALIAGGAALVLTLRRRRRVTFTAE